MKRIAMMIVTMLWCALSMIGACHADNQTQQEFSADAIRLGCSVAFPKQFHAISDDPLSTPLFDISVEWHCRDGETAIIDKYEINGASPEISTLFYWKNHSIVVLVRWSVNSRASDYVGDYYKVFSYRYEKVMDEGRFVKNETIMKNFPAGVDGRSKSGMRIIYPFKSAESIRKRLQRLNH
ncbi:hypothetical protein [Cupriavidus pauculus]|uniref:hypothetical protein n=1 Tax=Cupriavidus pauculus TaxID=82633 RepID=UPI001D0C7942|nr:hypothetical protein [Cupriavidus pauculus]